MLSIFTQHFFYATLEVHILLKLYIFASTIGSGHMLWTQI